MKVIAAYLLAVLGGNACPSADDLKHILSSVGADCDADRIDLLLSQVEGKDITELIAAGREKLASSIRNKRVGEIISSINYSCHIVHLIMAMRLEMFILDSQKSNLQESKFFKTVNEFSAHISITTYASSQRRVFE
nr:60S acidic ribosomal protein P2A-like [Ipomoea batatas]